MTDNPNGSHPNDPKEGLNLAQRLAIDKMMEAFPEGFTVMTTGGWMFMGNVDQPRMLILLGHASGAASQRLLGEGANLVRNQAAAQQMLESQRRRRKK